MAQPDISQILAALAQQPPAGTPSATPQIPTPQPPQGYPGMPGQPPSAPPQSYLPQPSSTGSVDLSSIKPVSSGSVSIADAIAKAKSIAADRGVPSYDPRSAPPREDPRLAGRGYQRSRSRSPPRRGGGYNDNPYRDERREDPRRSSSRRSPSPDRGFRGSRGEGGGGGGGETETIRVKSSLVGLIIGRNGENLRKVESETGCRVQFIQANEPGATERQCTLSGPTRAREAAKTAIFAIIDDNGGQQVTSSEKGSYTAGMAGRAQVNLPALRDGENSTQIMVPDKTVGLIIGRGGETIKDLQERSGCHVNIVGENKSINGLRPVNLIGNDQATAMAKEMILEIVESDNRGGPAPPTNRERPMDPYANRGGGGGAPQGRGGQIDKVIHVPSEAVGMIIGKGGETIKDMQRTTGCKINVNQPERPDINRKIDLSGSEQALAEAERIIWEKVETVQQRDAAAGRKPQGGGGGRDQGAPSYDQGGYGQYQQPQAQAAPQMPAFQMPQAAPQQPQAASDPNDPYAAYGGAAFYAQWYAAAMAQQQQQGQQGAPGPQ